MFVCAKRYLHYFRKMELVELLRFALLYAILVCKEDETTVKCRKALLHYTDELRSLQTGESNVRQKIWNERHALKFAHQVADGMVSFVCFFIHNNPQSYLSRHGFVHRDLAARNVLVKEDIAKVIVKREIY